MQMQRLFKIAIFNLVLIFLLVYGLGHGIALYFYLRIKDRFIHGEKGQAVMFDKLFKPLHKNFIIYPQYYSQYDSSTFYFNSPGKYDLALFDCNYSYQIDSAGMRVCGNTPSRKDNSLQIAVLGDSHAFGLGVSDNQTYASLLNANGYSTSLVACSSFGTVREFLKCEELAEHGIIEKPTVLVLHYCENDSLENVTFTNLGLHFKPSSPKEFYTHYQQPSHPVYYELIYSLLPVYLRPLDWPNAIQYQLVKRLSFEIPISRPFPVNPPDEPAPHSFDLDVEQIALHFLSKPAFRQVRHLILLNASSPDYFSMETILHQTHRLEILRDRLRECLPTVRVDFITPGEKDFERVFFEIDNHINAEGHAFFFSEIQKLLAEEHLN